MTYHDALTDAMTLVGADTRSLFLGQTVSYPGTGMTNTFKNVPKERLLEFPVAEEMQMGASIGLALAGRIPVSVYPRWNFLLLAANQLVNHLDRLPLYSNGGYVPHVIIRVAVPSVEPLDPQSQHDADFTDSFALMCRTVQFWRLNSSNQILPAYEYALNTPGAHVLVERVELYETT